MENLIESLTCFLNSRNGRHFLFQPKYLPCCNKTACDDCIRNLIRSNLFICPYCNTSSTIDVIHQTNECKLRPAYEVAQMLEHNLNDINDFLIRKLESSIKNTEERFENKDVILKKRQKFLNEEIHIQIEAIRAHLDELEEEMKQNLNISCENASNNMLKFEQNHRFQIVDMVQELENLKLNYNSSNSTENLAKVLQKQSLDKMVANITDLNRLNKTLNEMINEVQFSPNPDLPTHSLIGNLKQVKETNLIEQFKTIKSQTFISKIKSMPDSYQKVPITPRFITILDQYNLIFTDSQSKQLVQLSLDTGDFVKTSNLNGQVRNPDGVCIQPRTGHLYITDSELNQIIKLDSNFNVLKKFGNKDLKWPRGLAYDTTSEIEIVNKLYVCDYSNARIAIYNEHDQLRDCLSISVKDPTGVSKYSDNENEIKFCPLNVSITKSNIFVTDDWTGGNCIRVFDKKTHLLIRNIGDLNAWNPLGLKIDDNGNIFTIARQYYETGNSHLYCFKKNGEILYKTNLNINSELVTDFVVDNITDRNKMRMIACGDKKVHFIEF